MTRDEFVEMVDRADKVMVGIRNRSAEPLYLFLPKSEAVRQADGIVALGFLVEFGRAPGLKNTLYIESL